MLRTLKLLSILMSLTPLIYPYYLEGAESSAGMEASLLERGQKTVKLAYDAMARRDRELCQTIFTPALFKNIWPIDEESALEIANMSITSFALKQYTADKFTVTFRLSVPGNSDTTRVEAVLVKDNNNYIISQLEEERYQEPPSFDYLNKSLNEFIILELARIDGNLREFGSLGWALSSANGSLRKPYRYVIGSIRVDGEIAAEVRFVDANGTKSELIARMEGWGWKVFPRTAVDDATPGMTGLSSSFWSLFMANGNVAIVRDNDHSRRLIVTEVLRGDINYRELLYGSSSWVYHGSDDEELVAILPSVDHAAITPPAMLLPERDTSARDAVLSVLRFHIKGDFYGAFKSALALVNASDPDERLTAIRISGYISEIIRKSHGAADEHIAMEVERAINKLGTGNETADKLMAEALATTANTHIKRLWPRLISNTNRAFRTYMANSLAKWDPKALIGICEEMLTDSARRRIGFEVLSKHLYEFEEAHRTVLKEWIPGRDNLWQIGRFIKKYPEAWEDRVIERIRKGDVTEIRVLMATGGLPQTPGIRNELQTILTSEPDDWDVLTNESMRLLAHYGLSESQGYRERNDFLRNFAEHSRHKDQLLRLYEYMKAGILPTEKKP